MDSQITFTREIINKVAKDLNIEEKKVHHVYYSMVRYMEYLSKLTDTISIFIPNLGILYLKASKILSNKDKEHYIDKKKKLDLYLKDYFKGGVFKKSYHLDKPKINNFWYNGGKNIVEIEEKQNNL